MSPKPMQNQWEIMEITKNMKNVILPFGTAACTDNTGNIHGVILDSGMLAGVPHADTKVR